MLINFQCSDCGRKFWNAVPYRERCKKCWKKRNLTLNQARNKEVRLEALRHYSQAQVPLCKCCGQKGYQFLTIDHIKGLEGQPRQTNLPRWLKDNGYPEGFQILCWNCNMAKSKNGNVCPHQDGSVFLAEESVSSAGGYTI